MYLKNSYKDVAQELRDEIADNKACLEAWREVSVNRKKDGTEYKLLPRAISGGKISTGYSGDELDVYYKVGHRYCIDAIKAYVYVNELPEEDSRRNPTQWHPVVAMTPDEMRKAIADHIVWLEEVIADKQKDLENLEEVYDTFCAKLKEAESFLRGSGVSMHTQYKITYGINM